ncbi:MAG: hypothetical protein IJC48_03695 [Clostridia bacterium]|nr:hypothetical protein [Clostridia bacterium]
MEERLKGGNTRQKNRMLKIPKAYRKKSAPDRNAETHHSPDIKLPGCDVRLYLDFFYNRDNRSSRSRFSFARPTGNHFPSIFFQLPSVHHA